MTDLDDRLQMAFFDSIGRDQRTDEVWAAFRRELAARGLEVREAQGKENAFPLSNGEAKERETASLREQVAERIRQSLVDPCSAYSLADAVLVIAWSSPDPEADHLRLRLRHAEAERDAALAKVAAITGDKAVDAACKRFFTATADVPGWLYKNRHRAMRLALAAAVASTEEVLIPPGESSCPEL